MRGVTQHTHSTYTSRITRRIGACAQRRTCTPLLLHSSIIDSRNYCTTIVLRTSHDDGRCVGGVSRKRLGWRTEP